MTVRRPMRTAILALVAATAFVGAPAEAQLPDNSVRAYLRSVAAYFQVDPGEVRVLLDGAQSPDEIPVALYVAERVGISEEALLSLRRAGIPWSDLLARYGLHAGVLHVDLASSPEGGALPTAYAAYGARGRDDWRVIQLSDPEVVQLVNLRFLSSYLELPPERVAAELGRRGSVVEAHRALLRPGVP